MKKYFVQGASIIVYVSLGILIGLMMDSDWLTNEQMLYVQKLKTENSLLVEEKKAWFRYIENEIKQMKVYTNANQLQFYELKGILANIGISLEKVPDNFVYHQHGIIISIGEELEESYGLPLLKLESIPNEELDLNLLYLSLLRMKEELIQ